MVSTLLLWPVIAMLILSLIFDEKSKFLVTGWIGLIAGIGYFIWGLIPTFEVPDEFVDPEATRTMQCGFGLGASSASASSSSTTTTAACRVEIGSG